MSESSPINTILFSSTDSYILSQYGPKRDPLYVVIPITFVYMLIFVTGLAISDFLLLISGVPQEVYSMWSRYPYVFGEVFCVVRGLMAETSANATVLTITSFTVERYLAICHPFLQHTMSKLSRAIKLIIGVWIVSVSLAMPQALQFGVIIDPNNIAQCTIKRTIFEHSFELSTLLFFLTPMTLITVLYILIGLKLRTSGLMKRENGVSMQRRVHVNSCHRQQASVGTRRVLKMLVAVVVAFFFCWAPFHAQRLLASYAWDNQFLFVYVITTYVSGILYYLSTCINPLLYNIMSNKFREAFKESMAHFWCQLSKRSDNEKRTYRILSRSQRRWHSNQESGNYSGSSIRDESMHSTITQKQSIDSMTLPRGHSFKVQSSNQSKLKSNHKSKSSTLIPCQPNVDMAIGHIEKATNMAAISQKLKRLVNDEQISYGPEVNSNAIHYVKTTIPVDENRLPSTEFVSVTPNLETSHKKSIRLTMTPIHSQLHHSAKHAFYSKLRRSTTQPMSSWFGWFRPKRNAAFYSPPFEHPTKGIKIQIHINENPNGVHDAVPVDTASSNDDEEMSNSSLQNVDQMVLKDELAAYMDEIRAREKR